MVGFACLVFPHLGSLRETIRGCPMIRHSPLVGAFSFLSGCLKTFQVSETVGFWETTHWSVISSCPHPLHCALVFQRWLSFLGMNLWFVWFFWLSVSTDNPCWPNCFGTICAVARRFAAFPFVHLPPSRLSVPSVKGPHRRFGSLIRRQSPPKTSTSNPLPHRKSLFFFFFISCPWRCL